MKSFKAVSLLALGLLFASCMHADDIAAVKAEKATAVTEHANLKAEAEKAAKAVTESVANIEKHEKIVKEHKGHVKKHKKHHKKHKKNHRKLNKELKKQDRKVKKLEKKIKKLEKEVKEK